MKKKTKDIIIKMLLSEIKTYESSIKRCKDIENLQKHTEKLERDVANLYVAVEEVKAS